MNAAFACSIGDGAFSDCTSLEKVYYMGTTDDWANIGIGSYGNNRLIYATRYYYSKIKPTTAGNYWHYVDGVPTVWDVNDEPTTKPPLTYGDANGDGEINAKDVVLLKKYIANYDIETGTSSIILGKTK